MLWGCEFNVDHLGKHVFKLKIFWINDKQLLDLAIVWYDDAGALVIPRMAYSLSSFPKHSKQLSVCTASPSPQQKVGKGPPFFFWGGL